MAQPDPAKNTFNVCGVAAPVSREENIANARLIAEAPALYALALCALDYFDSPDRSQGQVDTIIDALRVTLAQIDGDGSNALTGAG